MTTELERRKGLTFKQAENLEPLPSQLRLTELSQALRAQLWAEIHKRLSNHISGDYTPRIRDPWFTILQDVHIYLYHRMADEFDSRAKILIPEVKRVFELGEYADVYGWLQHVIQNFDPYEFSENIDHILKRCRAPYRVIQGVICPIGSPEEAETISDAFSDLGKAKLDGAGKHLKNAAAHLTKGEYADSIRESIHTVESVARKLEPSGELSNALAELEASAKIHGALKSGFKSLYGYSSDSEGIRHALIEKGAPDVDETDALFMIGACAAFVSYLVNKGRKAGIIK